jgi:chaperonin cofactor prefoldin
VTLKAVQESEPERKLYRSIGRMFIMEGKDNIEGELKENIKSITHEQGRYTELKKTYEGKREHYIKVLNDLTASK